MRAVALVVSVLLLVALLAGCGPTIYKTTEFEQYRQTHKSIAILPFVVSIDPNKLPKNITPEQVEAQKHEEAHALQQQLYMRFLEREKKGEYTVDFQDVDKTNALLAKAGISDSNMASLTKRELKEILGVDAILSGTIYRQKLASTGAAIATAVLFGFFAATNEVDVNVNIHDAATDELVWKYEHKAKGSVGDSPEKMAKSLMKSVSKTFPYKKPKA